MFLPGKLIPALRGDLGSEGRKGDRDLPYPRTRSGAAGPVRVARRTAHPSPRWPAPDWFFWFSLPPRDALGDPMTSLAESLPLPPSPSLASPPPALAAHSS